MVFLFISFEAFFIYMVRKPFYGLAFASLCNNECEAGCEILILGWKLCSKSYDNSKSHFNWNIIVFVETCGSIFLDYYCTIMLLHHFDSRWSRFRHIRFLFLW
uniref:7TM GPCR serpentine receptor class x (Srx) domain-containing protein n=1 Tax=Parascaris equorum TaxID=6256 RepID=A0A914RPP4_PAREQ